MKLSKKYSEEKAIIVDAEYLKFLNDFLLQNFKSIKYTGYCVDDTVINFENFQELLDYENPAFRKLRCIQAYATKGEIIDELKTTLSLHLGGKWDDTTFSYSIDSNDLAITTFIENEIRERAKEMRPWYWRLSYINLNKILLFLLILFIVLVGIAIFIAEARGEEVKDAEWGFTPKGVAKWMVLTIGYIIIDQYMDKVWKYAFPKVTIILGKQVRVSERKKQVMSLIFITIVLGIVIGLLTEWIWDWAG